MSFASESKVRVETYSAEYPVPRLPASLKSSDYIPPVIYHVHCNSISEESEQEKLSDFLEKYTNIPGSLIQELIPFGSVYLRVGHPSPHMSPRPARILSDIVLPRGEPLYFRVHPTPKRHRARGEIEIIYECIDGLLVVNKPPGIPVVASVDNIIECVTTCVGAQVTHRLDIGTSGVLVLTRKRNISAAVNEALRSADKRYLVLTKRRPECGHIVHWFNKTAGHGRGLIKAALLYEINEELPQSGNWVRAELVIEQVQALKEFEGFESKVLLVTGRTHQIRLQFAAKGWSVWGDTKYEGAAGRLSGNSKGTSLGPDADILGLHAAELKMRWGSEQMVFTATTPWWRKAPVREPTEASGP